MKKIVILILTLSLLLALCACGEEQGAAVSGELHGKTPAEGEVPLGTVIRDGDTCRYENEFLGFGCRLDGWYVANEEQLAALAGFALDAFEDTRYEEIVRSSQVFYDLYAEGPNVPGTINLNFTRTGAPAGDSVEQHLDLAQEELKGGLEAAGMQNVRTEQRTVSFAGVEKSGIGFYAINQGVEYYGIQLYFTAGGRYATLTLGSFGSDKTDKLLELFYPLA